MPVYEYQCSQCSHEFEELVFGSETPECPKCSSDQLAKRVSDFGVGRFTPSFEAPSAPPPPPPGACGACGNPEGPGSC